MYKSFLNAANKEDVYVCPILFSNETRLFAEKSVILQTEMLAKLRL